VASPIQAADSLREEIALARRYSDCVFNGDVL